MRWTSCYVVAGRERNWKGGTRYEGTGITNPCPPSGDTGYGKADSPTAVEEAVTADIVDLAKREVKRLREDYDEALRDV